MVEKHRTEIKFDFQEHLLGGVSYDAPHTTPFEAPWGREEEKKKRNVLRGDIATSAPSMRRVNL